MSGTNRAKLAESVALGKARSSGERPCIFLSHVSEDKDAVTAIGNYIMEKGNLDIYMDVYDAELQRAVQNNDPHGITKFIERGLNSSTHLMCLYSEKTVRSWWVPYEIGYGKRSSSEVSSLKLKGTVELPSYLEIGVRILGTASLNSYLTKIAEETRKSGRYLAVNESIISSSTHSHPLDNYLDWNS